MPWHLGVGGLCLAVGVFCLWKLPIPSGNRLVLTFLYVPAVGASLYLMFALVLTAFGVTL
jgi:hypothetical protein